MTSDVKRSSNFRSFGFQLGTRLELYQLETRQDLYYVGFRVNAFSALTLLVG